MLKIKKKCPYAFKYCLDIYVIRDENCFGYCCKNGYNLINKIKIAHKAGYSAVEIWHKDVIKFVNEVGSIELLREEIDKIGLPISSYKVIDNWDQIEPLKYASILGAESCVTKVIPDEYSGPKIPLLKMVDRYKRLLEEGDKLNVKPSLEFMSCAKTYNSLNDVCDILESINHPKKSLVLDTWHLWRNGCKDFANCPFQRVDPKWISVVHYTDASKNIPRNLQTDGDRKMPNEGVLNLVRFCEKLKELKFQGWLSLNVYDKSLWHEDPLKVATRGLIVMKQTAEKMLFQELSDSEKWSKKQEIRCDGLWTKQYHSHLDPRICISNRDAKLEKIIGHLIRDKIVLDFKCGFSPLGKYVSYGFDAYKGCIEYLTKQYPNASWMCMSDKDFANTFREPLDVLLHIGLGDSNTEEANHMLIREQCKPKMVIIECAANSDGTVNEAKPGSTARWNNLKKDLVNIQEHVIHTDMAERSHRLLLIGDLLC